MTSHIGFLISMFGTKMCGQTLLFIVIAKCAIQSRKQSRMVFLTSYSSVAPKLIVRKPHQNKV